MNSSNYEYTIEQVSYNPLGWKLIYQCDSTKDIYLYLKEMLESGCDASYRILVNGNVKWFMNGIDGIKYYVNDFARLVSLDKKLNHAHSEFKTEELKTIKENDIATPMIDLATLDVYNGVKQEWPKKPYPENCQEYDDYLIQRIEKEINKKHEEEEEEILRDIQVKLLTIHQNFYH